MSSSQNDQPTLISIAPRFLVGDMELALAFYAQLGFTTNYRDGEFAIVERDVMSLHFNGADGYSVCWIGVTNIEALYQQYLPTSATQPPLTSQPWGMKEFVLCDPFRDLLLFGESIPKEERSTEPGA
ncbi:hypothetical protein KDA_47630 [Dictyobacter alpinus]|uniref:Bleomycin resistance protein n=1 Tax=Dictyobacter alpinus TaxID=2014873 RepID=A0A402BD51_9CHLR|nr:VOC family protein [Dictyobacter alpinus]GCE29279.1 hypothetical protein KDA_47630 [Dictyobacter alpinus]